MLSALAFTAVLIATSLGAAIDDYLKVRKSSQITAVTTPQVLDSLVGTKTVEISGIVKGVVSIGDGSSLLLQRTDGNTIYVKAKSSPSWLDGNEVPVRMILKVTREHDTADLSAGLIAVIPEPDIKAWEAKQVKPSPKVATAKTSSNSKAPLTGSISRGGSRLENSTRAKATTTSRSASAPRSWTVAASDATPLYAKFVKDQNPKLSDKEATRIAEGVIGFSLHYKVDARLVMALILAESNFNPKATSRAGAQGLVQLMPGTAAELGVQNSYDSIDNLYGAVKLIKSHLDKYKASTGDDYDALVLALAAYNAGPGAVKRHGGVPPYKETQNYVRKVIGYYRKICGE